MKLMENMGNILAVLPSYNAYNCFKAAILRCTTEYESNRLQQLLNVEELGARRPCS